MRIFVLFLLTSILSGFTIAQVNPAQQGQKKEATFVKEGKALNPQPAVSKENSIKSFKIRPDGTVKARRSKGREMMDSASSSGPACKIEKLQVKRQTPESELPQILGEPEKIKKRAEK